MIRGERQKWVSLAVLFAVAMLNYADRTSISAVFPLLRAELAMSDVGLAALGSFFLWSYAAGSPLAGLLADRYSRSRMVVGSLAAWSLVTLWTGMARSAEELLLTRVLLGLTECAYLPAAIALIADHHPTASRATAIGIHTAGLNFGLVAGGTLAGYLGDHVGWRPGFFILGGAGVALAGLAAAVLRDAPRPASKPAQAPSARESVARLARIPSYWILLGEGMLMAVGIWMFFNWLPLYFRETFNMSLAGAGLSGTLMLQVAATLGAVGGGYFSDQIARRNPNRRMLFQSLCYLAGAPLLLAFLGRPAFGFLGACIFGFALLRALGGASQLAVLSDLLPSQFRSTSIGLMNTANCFAGGIGVLVAGHLKQDFGLGGVFAGVASISVLASVLLWVGYRFLLAKDMARFSERRPVLAQV